MAHRERDKRVYLRSNTFLPLYPVPSSNRSIVLSLSCVRFLSDSSPYNSLAQFPHAPQHPLPVSVRVDTQAGWLVGRFFEGKRQDNKERQNQMILVVYIIHSFPYSWLLSSQSWSAFDGKMAPYVSSLILHFLIYYLTLCESLPTWDEVSGLLPSTLPPPLPLASVADDDGTPFDQASQGKVFLYVLIVVHNSNGIARSSTLRILSSIVSIHRRHFCIYHGIGAFLGELTMFPYLKSVLFSRSSVFSLSRLVTQRHIKNLLEWNVEMERIEMAKTESEFSPFLFLVILIISVLLPKLIFHANEVSTGTEMLKSVCVNNVTVGNFSNNFPRRES